MTARPTGNRSDSVRQCLLNLAKARGEEFQRILTRYALEPLLYRLSVSDQKDRFPLKGALLIVVKPAGSNVTITSGHCVRAVRSSRAIISIRCPARSVVYNLSAACVLGSPGLLYHKCTA